MRTQSVDMVDVSCEEEKGGGGGGGGGEKERKINYCGVYSGDRTSGE